MRQGRGKSEQEGGAGGANGWGRGGAEGGGEGAGKGNEREVVMNRHNVLI